ncbi:CAF17-like 4Fe-4S cluster assembly/insertion protein YgfZ [Ciceribacter ferrooxidans]|uniref:Folate-binding protein n=1 Tax=Ciceribacter ferrooxidans TaxID=2509717 RepID=A0A4Q2TJU3_9HYPH|nr:folate-binding protein YgfZ [Ciceribacter ferrooxidans]RYC17815.1 folate-binding protein [Ciceribacter ferrooxidans]
MPAAFLPDRALIRVSGPEAEHFLQNLVTTDVAALPAGEARPGALLTPQGKILFDFLISRDGDGFLLETAAGQQADLVKRLTMYKLRSAVTIAAEPEAGVTVSWGEERDTAALLDKRFAIAGAVLGRRPGRHAGEDDSAYLDLRIAAGIAESGADFALQDAFPHDVLMDRNGGVGFKKGCYVGQEVVSRMQHRGTARRRVVLIGGEAALPAPGTEITAGGKPVGTLGSVHGARGLAIVRIDRVGEALATGVPVLAGETALTVDLPAWSGLDFPTVAEEA